MASAAPTLSPRQPASSPRMFKTALVVLFLLTAGLWLSSRGLLASNFLPHWYCLVGNKRLLWTTVIADMIIGLSYVAISVALATLVRRAGRDLPYAGFFWAFGLFMVSCGATHFLEVVTVWKPVYWLAAATKVLTAAMSAGTALVLLIAADDIVDFVHTAREAVTRRGFERFRALVEAAPMAVVSSDLEGKVTAWNPTAEHLFGWSAGEAVGKSVPLVPPEKMDEYDQLRLKTIAGEITKGLETLRLNRNGEPIPVSISTAPVCDENGSLAGTIAVIEDISERKRIARELQEKTARQEEEVRRASLPAGVSEEPGGGITVLVADDEAALRNTIVEILRSSGYNVLESQTAEDALEIARQNAGQIDILLTDIEMPGLRGPELARRIQNIQSDVKVIFMSGYAEGLPEAELPPNSAFLQKPFRFATLLEQLKLIRRKV